VSDLSHAAPRDTTLRLLLGTSTLLLGVFLLGITMVFKYTFMSPINRLVGIAYVGMMGVAYLKARVPLAAELVLFGLFLAWAIASGLAWAVDSEATMDTARLLVQIWAMVFAVAGLSAIRGSMRAQWLILIGVAFFLLAYWFVAGDVYRGARSGTVLRARSIMRNANGLATMMLFGVMGIAYLVRERTSTLRWGVAVAAAAPLVFLMIRTGSRKGFLSLLIFIFLWLWFCKRPLLRRHLSVVVLLGVFGIGGYFLTDYVIERTYLGQRFEEAADNPEVSDTRAKIYRSSVDVFLDNPVAGVGLGNFVQAAGMRVQSHSNYVEAFTTTGAVGGILFYLMYVLLWVRASTYQARATDDATRYDLGLVKAILLIMLILDFVAIGMLIISHWFVLGTLMGYVQGVGRRLRQQANAPREVPA